jgi:hypothetical protein
MRAGGTSSDAAMASGDRISIIAAAVLLVSRSRRLRPSASGVEALALVHAVFMAGGMAHSPR